MSLIYFKCDILVDDMNYKERNHVAVKIKKTSSRKKFLDENKVSIWISIFSLLVAILAVYQSGSANKRETHNSPLEFTSQYTSFGHGHKIGIKSTIKQGDVSTIYLAKVENGKPKFQFIDKESHLVKASWKRAKEKQAINTSFLKKKNIISGYLVFVSSYDNKVYTEFIYIIDGKQKTQNGDVNYGGIINERAYLDENGIIDQFNKPNAKYHQKLFTEKDAQEIYRDSRIIKKRVRESLN